MTTDASDARAGINDDTLAKMIAADPDGWRRCWDPSRRRTPRRLGRHPVPRTTEAGRQSTPQFLQRCGLE